MRVAHDYVKNAASGSGHAAISPQQLCSIRTAGNFVVSDGISKTTVWRKQGALIEELQRCGNVPAWHAGCFGL